jgi:hypothetical protein
MKLRVLVVTCALVPAVAFAQPAPEPAPPAPPAPAPAPAPEAAPIPAPPSSAPPAPVLAPPPSQVAPMPAPGGPPLTGVQLQARVPTQIGLASVITPGFSIGYRLNKVVLGLQFGLSEGKLSDNNVTDAVQLYSIMPTVSDDLWLSDDGRARLNITVGIGFGKGSVESTDTAGGGTSQTDLTYLPTLIGVGGDYYLHRNFALGVEVASEIPVILSVTDNGMDRMESGFADAIHGIVRVTFIAGR